MTPVPLDLPLRPAEASQLASLILDHAERKPLTAEIRNRIAARGAALHLETITPYFGSLERDPVHPSAYYLAVDGAQLEPLLLHLALATAPTSSIFYKPLLIGRTRRANGPEIVVNAVPFGASDRENLAKFAAQIDHAFLPRPQGSRTAIAVGFVDPQAGLPAAFAAFRGILKRTGKNLAAICVPNEAAGADIYHAGLWAAIRAGWREGYSATVSIPVAADSLETAREAIRQSAAFSTFRIDAALLFQEHGDLPARFEKALTATAQLHETIRQSRSALQTGRAFDLELALDGAPRSTTPQELDYCLQWLRACGHAPQLAAPNLGAGDEPAGDLEELAAAARQHQCVLSVRGRAAYGPHILERIARATAGRVHYTVESPLAGQPGYIDFLAAQLIG